MAKKKMLDQVTIRLPEKQYRIVERLAMKERRKVTEVARLLLEKGLNQFLEDGILIPEVPGEEEDPEEPTGSG